MAFDRTRTARSAFWSALENGSLALVSFIMLVLYSRVLLPSDFGLFSIVIAFVEILGLLVGMLFHDALVQKADASDIDFDTAFTFSLGLSLVLVAVCWTIAPWFARLVHHPEAAEILRWLSLIFPVTAVSATIIARQRRNFEFKALAIRSLAGRIIGAVAGIAAALQGAGLWSLVIQQVLMAVVGSAVLWMTCRERPHLRFAAGPFAALLRFGMISIGALFLQFVIVRGFTMAVGILLGAESAGYVNIAFRTVDMFWAVAFTAIAQVALPTLSRLQADPKALKSAYQKAVSFASMTLYPCFVGLGLLAPEAVELLFGPRWLPSAPLVTALGCLVLLRGAILFNSPILTAVGRPQNTLVGVCAEAVFLAFAIALVRPANADMIVAIWVAREVVCAPVRIAMLWRATQINPLDQLRGALVPLAATAAMAAGVIFARTWLLADPGVDLGPALRAAILAPIGGLIYVAALYALDRRLLGDLMRFGLAGVRGVVPAK